MRPLLPSSAVRPLRILLVVAITATVVALLAGLVLVSRLESRVRTTLDLASEAVDTAQQVAEPAEQLAADLAALAAQVRSLTANAAQLTQNASLTTKDVAAALGGNLRDTVQGAADVAGRTAGFVERVERLIPGNSTPSLADELRTFADGLEPVPQQLLELSARLSTAATSLSKAGSDLSSADPTLAALVSDIEASQQALAQIPAQLQRTQDALQQTEDELGRDAWVLRILVLFGGIGVLAALVALERLVAHLGRIELPEATLPPPAA
jgi:chromosome segregation ATPase